MYSTTGTPSLVCSRSSRMTRKKDIGTVPDHGHRLYYIAWYQPVRFARIGRVKSGRAELGRPIAGRVCYKSWHNSPPRGSVENLGASLQFVAYCPL
jgi:hypothetical protein